MEKKYALAFRSGRPQHGTCDEFSLRHPKMSLQQRAKIFSPFDALKGFSESIEKKLELYVEKHELTEEEQAELDRTLAFLSEKTKNRRLARENQVTVTALCYVPCSDEQHEAYGLRGRYETVTGTVWKVDALKKTLQLGETVLDFADLAELRICVPDEEESKNVLPLLYGDVAEAAADRGGGAALQTLYESCGADRKTAYN